MATLIAEDTTTTRKSSNPLGSYLDAKERDAIAKEQHKGFFDTDEHVDRLVAVSDVLKGFFGRSPDYITARGINRKRPFENVKYEHVGSILSRTPADVKNARLYAPLLALGNVEVISKNGHLTVRVF